MLFHQHKEHSITGNKELQNFVYPFKGALYFKNVYIKGGVNWESKSYNLSVLRWRSNIQSSDYS